MGVTIICIYQHRAVLLTLCTGGGVVCDRLITWKYHQKHIRNTAALLIVKKTERHKCRRKEWSSYSSGSNHRLWPQLVSGSWQADPPLVSHCTSFSRPSSTATRNNRPLMKFFPVSLFAHIERYTGRSICWTHLQYIRTTWYSSCILLLAWATIQVDILIIYIILYLS